MLLQARHPLVENCIPNDIVLGENGTVELAPGGESAPGFDVMLITGPNTGGKTVVLKTLGLLTLMACCGLHIPVLAGSRLAIPEQVFADIGDEQSIEQSLSTFSAHIKNIVHILRQAGTGDLILLDEVGAGTDPDEGAALAKAVLRSLQRRGSLVIATTHYGELKQFALGSRRFENASVEFDTATLRPTYRLRIGIPGASNALDIAARLGMPAELVSRARRYLGRERAEAEEATQRLERTHRELADQTESAQRERGEIDRLRREYEVNVARIESEAGAKIEAARNDARALVRETQAEADRILRDLRSAARESKQTEQARGRLRTLGEKLATARQEPSAPQVAARTLIAPAPSPAQSRETLRVGDMVRVAKIDKEGELLSGPDSAGRVEVRVGAVKVQLDRSEIEKSAGARQVGGVSGIRVRKSFTLPDELNVIGLTTDEALPLVEKYIDDALMAESERVRIVHGRGTGVLRKAIHRYLKGHGGIGEFSAAAQNEGGDGATIVIFE